ncbi:MAG: hypothetical protein J6W52_09915 [Bacteroidaceae bacterium]|nr:hypothetical protein [Bacteroidaceae bacterium]
MNITFLPPFVSRFAACMFLAVVGLLMTEPTTAQNVLTPNEESGIDGATYTWTDTDGNVFGFSSMGNRYVTSPFELTLRGIVPSTTVESTSLTVPDVLTLDGQEMSVVCIYYGVFQGFPALTTLTLPARLLYVNYETLNACSETLTDLYCRSYLPPKVQDLNYTSAYNAIERVKLHVPASSVAAYANAAYWNKMTNISAFDESADCVNLYCDYTVTDVTGITPNAKLRIISNRLVPEGDYYYYNGPSSDNDFGAHVDVNTPTPWQFGNFFMEQPLIKLRSWGSEINYYEHTSPTLIPQSQMTATGDVAVQIGCRNNAWKFFSLPFDVYMGDISVSHKASWVIRRFLPRERAALSGNTWQNVGIRDTLRANTGYIIYVYTPNSDDIPMLTVKAANNAKKQGLFATGDVTVPLVQTDAAVPQDQNWNYIGNPYPAFYDMGQSDYTAPYTVWQRGGNYLYEVYSPLDDNYALQPFEGLFVQCPDGTNSITFQATGRMHTPPVAEDDWYYSAPRRARTLQNRQLYNIFLSAGEFSDRARIVVNSEAREGYELERDASKMMSTDTAVPQIYVINGGINYAIDERPLGNGRFTLGMRFANAGDYTLRLETRGEAQNVFLTDRLTDETFDLSLGENYTFFAEAGTANDRFTLTIGDDTTGINTIDNGQLTIDNATYDLSGRKIVDGKLSNGKLPKGIYVKQGKKMIIK